MPDNYISGNTGYTRVGGVDYGFTKWSLPIKGGTKVFFAFGSDFQRTLEGGKGAQITWEGFYNQGNMPLVIGNVYALRLGWMTGVELTVNARCGDIQFGNEIGAGGTPGGTCTVLFESEGPFSVSFS